MELFKLLEVLRTFIAKSAKGYDDGNEIEALSLAVKIRTLCHDTQRSPSLLNQLGIKKDIWLLSTVPQFVPVNPEAYHGLVSKRDTVGPVAAGEFTPLCNVLDGAINKWHAFEDWWNELVVNHKAYSFSRKDVVLMVANIEGGTYVNDDADEDYANLEYDISVGWTYSDGVKRYLFSNSEAYAAMREIAHEILIAIEYFRNIRSYTRRAIGKVNAMYLDNIVYFAPYECEKDPDSAKIFLDPGLSKIDRRKIFCDSLVFTNDSSKHERFVIV